LEAHQRKGEAFGVDVLTGEALPAATAHIWDNYIVKRQFLNIAPVLCEQLLLVDEVMRAGRNMKRGGPSGAEE
jgi:T-complex protein 1 subunit zeta